MKNKTTLFFLRKSERAICSSLVAVNLKSGAIEPILASNVSEDASKFVPMDIVMQMDGDLLLFQQISKNPIRCSVQPVHVGAFIIVRSVDAGADQRQRHVSARTPERFTV
jgi:hypothetical protein